MSFKIFVLESKEVSVPSTDYYARPDQNDTETILVLNPYDNYEYKTKETAIDEIKKTKAENNYLVKTEFVILEIY